MVKNTRRLAGSRRITPDWGDAIIHIIQDFIRESSQGHLSGKAWAHKSRNVREFANSSLWGGYKDSLDPALSDLNGWYRNRSEGIEVGSVGRSVAIFHSWFHVYKGHQLRWWDTQGNDPSMSDETRHSLVHDGCFSPKMRFTLLFILAYSALKSPVSQVRYHLKTLIEQHSNCQLSYAAYKWELCCCCCKKLPGSLSWVISTP